MAEPSVHTCIRCGRARPQAEGTYGCGETRSVEAVPGGFYDALVGIFADPARGERVLGTQRGTELTLMREPDNPHDPNAVAVLDSDGMMLGYVPRQTAEWLAPRIDASERWAGKVARVLGRSSRGLRMVMFLHRPDTPMPEGDPWESLPEEARPRKQEEGFRGTVMLRDERVGTGQSYLWAHLDGQGNLHINGQDFGPTVVRLTGDDEHEYFETYAAKVVPRIVEVLDGEPGEPILDVLSRWTGDRSYEMHRRLSRAKIPYRLHTC